MQYIKLTQNKQAIVDDKDYEWLNQYQSKHYYIGLFKTREEASRAYQEKLVSLT